MYDFYVATRGFYTIVLAGVCQKMWPTIGWVTHTHVHDNTRLPHRNSTASAMIMQLKETYGLKRVPMTDPL